MTRGASAYDTALTCRAAHITHRTSAPIQSVSQRQLPDLRLERFLVNYIPEQFFREHLIRHLETEGHHLLTIPSRIESFITLLPIKERISGTTFSSGVANTQS
jgi:hypothetical protein